MNKKQLIIELAMPIVFALVSIYIIVKAIPMEGEGVLLIGAAYLFFETLVKKEEVVKLEGVNLGKVGITLLALIVYVVLLKKIGYIIDTFLLCVFIIRSLGYKKIGITVLCAALAVCATFFVFKVLLSVPLPMIFLDF